MLYPIKVIDIELINPITTVTGLDRYMGLQALVRVQGMPIGYINMPVTNGQVSAKSLTDEIIEKYSGKIIGRLLKNWLASSVKSTEPVLNDLFDIEPKKAEMTFPLITVAVCTRDRTSDLAECLAALCKVEYPNLDLLVVDNAPDNDATEQLVKTNFPHIRYVLESRPGLDWARNRAIMEAKGEIIAFTDDDVIVDSKWVGALAVLFSENDEVMAVTGLVVPSELETPAQVLFEMYGGFGKGFERKFHRYRGGKLPWGVVGTGQFGTGANMAYRLSIFDKIGYFDPALDVGTVTNGGGDLEMFFRVLKEGHTLVYEPAAIVRHRHRREYAKLKVQLTNNSRGLLAYCMRSISAYPNQRVDFLRLWYWWFTNWNLNRLMESYLRPVDIPRDLLLAELKGCFTGINVYRKARKLSIEIANKSGDTFEQPARPVKSNYIEDDLKIAKKDGMGLVSIDLCKPLQPPIDITNYSKVRYYLNWNGIPVGSIDISNDYTPFSTGRFIETIVKSLGSKLLQRAFNINKSVLRSKIIAALQHRNKPGDEKKIDQEQLPNEFDVSVVVATYDRPDDLIKCLQCLAGQQSERPIEIIVVDNNPGSGLTPPVIARFPGVILVSETRKGLSYARNAGINASKGKIIVSTDDDVIAPSNWIESLIAPFTRSDVMVVTGNVLPVELATTSQQLFEEYGGLGRGFERKEITGQWFQSYKRGAVPTWKLGACANAAFRACIFSDPEIGMINEKLGAGTPTGCSEDTYLFYKVLKKGYTLIYEPKACVWHNHRRTMKSLRKQIYNYSKGHVAYHLETWLVDKDWRALTRILVEVPKNLITRLWKSLKGHSILPTNFILSEIAGSMAGPWALLRSSLRVRKLGRSSLHSPAETEKINAGQEELFFK